MGNENNKTFLPYVEPMKPETDSPLEDPEKIAQNAYLSLKEKCLQYLEPSVEPILYKAFQFAHNLHAGQMRKSGEPYIIHPLAVAEILSEFKMDETSLVAAVLHDVVEDTHVSVEEVSKEFGEQVAALVEGLTKLAKVQFRSSQEKMAENFRKMIVAMSRDIRVIIVKLADRTHNMRTLRALSLEKRQRIAEETLEIYAPLAGRLGMYKIKAELEDLCLRELKPSVYYSLIARVAQKKTERDKIIEQARDHLDQRLKEAQINAKVYGRAKHFYSIYRKMSDKQIEFEDIYDLFALRVIVNTVNECYETLGIIHNIYRPVPGRFKDFIAMPKANLYQSLHTTIVAAKGELLEVQIRTAQMHHIAENGIAAHWAYKERKKDPSSAGQVNPAAFEKFKWLKQIVKHQKELSDPDEFLEAVKVDLFDEEVYVFSPKGDVFELRKGATCLDFAFAIHTDLGLKTTGAKINGRIATLRTRLHSGDVIELLVGNKVRATKDWLNFTTTTKARNKIRAWLRSEERTQAKQLGQELLEEELTKNSSSFEKLQKMGVFQELNRLFSVGGYEDFILQIGYGKIDVKPAVQKLLTSLQLPKIQETIPIATEPVKTMQQELQEMRSVQEAIKQRQGKNRAGGEDAVRVQGMTGIVVRMARCCEPLPGQPIVGFVSRSRGVTVHAASCQWALSNDPARRVDCSWNIVSATTHNVRVRITAHDKPGILAAITKMVSASHINIAGMECFTNPQKRAVILLKLELTDIHQLKDIHQKIEAVDGVIYVERTMG
ncbi:bifunctional (p)ppGpp synthetase/guanosine-3',5'-bis(diphosphate) 3'-pyrophosphohydrolase [Pigmentibacter sp. JX0631]|uniref:RelA/SpoT family protein n=1 Tax=Pigmentibacter sp. JX0631 TaxID=2976982 RepID=UPI0024686DA7|nr:bifunctional (p)ppGpp synthetase/guanosine-3',5'-bis(diphosphate) 3'-pyrophosphohydrolase [Pigmentibacter sp. JX0631]WGL59230.1 bifunctional (p)ppGpp synthetase/guanosine-3',5'-bis(diphosphate) 3'-pyrophosphohydrolase [Pigmentibacter sp. JX0631]